MKKIAIVADTNSGISKEFAQENEIFILPMPFNINGKDYLEGVDLTHEEFYEKVVEGADINTSQPSIGSLISLWEDLLKEHDEVVHIPMTSSLSSSYETAEMLSKEYGGKVRVIDNKRISITQKSSVVLAKEMAKKGKNAIEIKDFLEKTKKEAIIYITVDTLKYLKKGGRITPAAAAIGELLKINPVLQLRDNKIDAFGKVRTRKLAKKMMIDSLKNDLENVFYATGNGDNIDIYIAYTNNKEEAEEFYLEVKEVFPNYNIKIDILSLSIACHLGPSGLALACVRNFNIE